MNEINGFLNDARRNGGVLYESNLFLAFEELAGRLITLIQHAPSHSGDEDPMLLDSFLLSAGLNQILEDYLHRDVLSSRKVAKYAAVVPIVGPAIAVVTRAVGRACVRLRSHLPWERRLRAKQRDLARFVARLARAVADITSGSRAKPLDRADSTTVMGMLGEWRSFPSRLRRSVQRVPNCFRSFDQQPADCERLVERFAGGWPDRYRPLLVLGLRTSGSYLAPLVASFLTQEGYESVDVLTLRPGLPLHPHEKTLVCRVAKAGGLALIVDDPPKTGSQLAATTEELASYGLRDVVLLLQLSENSASLPDRIRHLPAVVLPNSTWMIHDRLRPAALETALAELLVGRRVTIDGSEIPISGIKVDGVRHLPPRRGHVGAKIDVRVIDESTGAAVSLPVYAKGVGVGYFGRHVQVAAAALGTSVPETFGVRDGLFFRRWLPEEARLTPARLRTEGEELADAISRYVVTRHRTLPLKEDFSLQLQRLDPVWEHIANMLGAAFGGAHQFVRSLTFSAAKRLASVTSPSVTDGRTSPWEWYRSASGALRKTDFHQRGSSNMGFRSCDPVFDLADAAAAVEAAGDPSFGNLLKHDYEKLTSEHVDSERWLLYRLLHHFGTYQSSLRCVARDPSRAYAAFQAALRAERAMADIHRRYFEERYFADLLPVREGPFCAIDIDGVLETRWLAFPAIAPAGAAALRSLAVHGYRAVLVTGRSLEEVRARCRSYRLTGGVAEYGAVTYDALRGSARSRLSEHDWAALEALRNALTQMDGVYLDPIYRHTVRAFRLGSAGERRGLKMETIAAALERAGVEECVRAVRGGLQTDFVAKSVDKGRGLRALMEEFGNGDLSSPVALAVGDTASDLPMFAVARRAIAPANAAPELRGHVEIGRRPFGAGLLDAVNAEVHAGTRCRRCEARPGASHSAALLQASLRALDGGKFGKLQQAAVLAVTLLSGV